MKIVFNVPSLGESIHEVVVGSILVSSGNNVNRDQDLVEIETDKVNQILHAPEKGSVHWSVKEGDRLKIGAEMGWIETEVNAVNESSPKVEEPLRASKKEFTEEIKREIVSIPIHVDAEKQIEKPTAESRRPLSNIRRIISKKLLKVQSQTASLTTFNEVDLGKLTQIREDFKEAFLKKHGVKLGWLSFFIKAVVGGLKDFPDLYSFIEGEEIVQPNQYDIGVAVGTEKGVIVPVIRHCDALSLAQIEQQIEQFAKKARDGTLSLKDLQGGVFTITNGGIYGSLLSTPILNPQQSGILGMHKIEKRAVVVEDKIIIRPMMYLALTYDHRIVDGREAVSFLVRVKKLLEEPDGIFLEL